MKKARATKENKKPITKDDILDEIVPKRAVEKNARALKVFKMKPDLKTRGVNSTDFGFTQKLMMFVLPSLTNTEITEKFKLRLNHEPVSNFRKVKSV